MEDGIVSHAKDDWAPFGAPLFDRPDARALGRVGVIDVGSNSVRLVVFDGAARSPAYFYNEKILCGLGQDLAKTGYLHPQGRVRAMDTLRRFAQVARSMNATPLVSVATAAVRQAKDGPAFCAEVAAQTGLALKVIDGEHEARLSAQGVLLGWPHANGIVCDIGGSSMELAEISQGQVGAAISAELGPMTLLTLKGGRKARNGQIDATLADMRNVLTARYKTLYLVGGSWRAIARIDMERRSYPLRVLHEYILRPQDIRDTLRYVSVQNLDALRQRAGISAARIALVPLAGEVLLRLLTTFKPKQVAISAYGLREGLLYENMPQALRQCDPLIEACRFAEAKDARLPGFGRALHHFIAPLFPNIAHSKYRIMRAACLLHDVSWRTHPDYRAENCFDYATRANLGGLTHAERIYLGLALLHRYRNRRAGQFDVLLPLIGKAEAQEAEILGKAMRFGAMFSALDPTMLGTLAWAPRKKQLRLILPNGPGQDMFGEVAKARFDSLAMAMDAQSDVTFAK